MSIKYAYMTFFKLLSAIYFQYMCIKTYDFRRKKSAFLNDFGIAYPVLSY